MSDHTFFESPLVRWGAYALAGLLLAAEAAIALLMLRPDVPEDFRAYYIDRTTTCLNQPVSGTYTFGTVVDFTPDGKAAAMPLRVCGWEGPAGDGTHAVGTSSRLRFMGEAPAGAKTLVLQMVAVTRDGGPRPQRVEVVLDDMPVTTLEVEAGDPQAFSVAVPEGALEDGALEAILRFPDAVQMGRTDPDTRWRSIKLLSAGIVQAPPT